MKINVKATGIKRLQKKLSKRDFLNIYDRHIGLLANHVKGQLERAAPRKTGKLRSRGFVRKHMGRLRWGIVSGVSYEPILRSGAKPHVIRSRGKGSLKFAPSGVAPGGVLFRKVVNHPGFPARTYDKQAVQASQPYIKNMDKQLGRAVALELEKG